MRTMTQPDVFAQIHSEMQNQSPSATGDVSTQIHQEKGGSMIDFAELGGRGCLVHLARSTFRIGGKRFSPAGRFQNSTLSHSSG